MAVVVAGLLCAWFFRGELIDDAYISFRYAANLLDGHGLVFNPGEHVEGYTNFLWVMVLALGRAAGAGFEQLSRYLGLVFVLATVAVTVRAASKTIGRDRRFMWLAVALLAGNAACAMWGVHGLETAMFTFFFTAAWTRELRWYAGGDDVWGSAALYGLAALTRPEGLMLFAASLAHRFWTDRGRTIDRSGLIRVLVFAVPVVVHLVWRRTYYGDWLPNTYYVKVGGTWETAVRGAGYVAELFATPGGVLFLIAVPAVWASFARHRTALRFVSWMALAAAAIVILEGGDAFPAHRFLIPVLPLLYLLVGCGAEEVGQYLRGKKRVIQGGLLAGLLLLASLHELQMVRDAQREAVGANLFTAKLKSAASALKGEFPPGTSIALNPVGVIPYETGFRTYDMLGLTDRTIGRTPIPDAGSGQAGHERGNGAYILEKRPDLIFAGNVLVLAEMPARLRFPPPAHRSEREIFASPELRKLYTAQMLTLSNGRILAFLRRKDTIP